MSKPTPRETLNEYLTRLKEQMRYRHTADLIVRSDGIDHRYEADYLDYIPRLVEEVLAAHDTAVAAAVRETKKRELEDVQHAFRMGENIYDYASAQLAALDADKQEGETT